jgi:PPOX class probable F420-dependent enzyme
MSMRIADMRRSRGRTVRDILAGMNETAATTAPNPAARIRRFLEREAVVWLSTTRSGGLPHLVPCWFWWDGVELIVFSKPDAVKVRNLRENPALMLALGDAEADFDIGLVEARATLHEGAFPVPEAMYDKYARQMASTGLDRRTFAETYSQAILIAPTRFLPWHGRTVGDVAPEAFAPAFLQRLRGAIGGLRLNPLGWLNPARRPSAVPAG